MTGRSFRRAPGRSLSAWPYVLPKHLPSASISAATWAAFRPRETAAYIRHQLKLAGADQELFTAKALDPIHWACNRLPRPIHQLPHLCLMAAAGQDRLVDHDLVEACACQPKSCQARFP